MTRLEELVERAKKIDLQIADLKAIEEAGKVVQSLAADMAKALVASAARHKVALATLHGKQLSIAVADGKVTFSVVEAAKKSNGNKKSGSGNGNYEYKLKDGRTFERVVDAIEAMTGKSCELKHDGKTYDDGKPQLRYQRLPETIRAAIEQVTKPAVAEASHAEVAEVEAEVEAEVAASA